MESKALVNTTTSMEISMKDNFKTMLSQATAKWNIQMKIYTRAFGLVAKRMDKENIIITMAFYTKVISSMGRKAALGL